MLTITPLQPNLQDKHANHYTTPTKDQQNLQDMHANHYNAPTKPSRQAC